MPIRKSGSRRPLLAVLATAAAIVCAASVLGVPYRALAADNLGRSVTGLFGWGQAGTVTDDLGHAFRLPDATPARIVSMAPNITEILFALGLGDRIVGDTRFCDYPPAATAIPKIGGLIDPNIEIVASLRPDLVIAFRGNPLRVVDRIRGLGLPVFVLDIGNGLDALFPLITKIALITRRENEAAALVSSLRARVNAVEDRLADVNPGAGFDSQYTKDRPTRSLDAKLPANKTMSAAAKPAAGTPISRPRVFVILHSQGLWTSGGQGYLSDVIARAGAVNIAAPIPSKWVLYSRERIVRDDPDAIFILSRSHAAFEEARAWLAGEAGLGVVAAVKAGRVYELDENAASRFGPRLVDVLDAIARVLHPGASLPSEKYPELFSALTLPATQAERFKIGAVSTQCQKNWHCVDTAPSYQGGAERPR